MQEVEELKPLLRELASQRQLADIVLVEIGSQGPFDYYARQVGVSRDGVILFASRAGTAPCNDRPALETGRFLTDRVWVVSSHRLVAKQRLGTLDDMLARIRTVSHEVRHLHDTSADAYLFDPSAGPQNRSRRCRPTRSAACPSCAPPVDECSPDGNPVAMRPA